LNLTTKDIASFLVDMDRIKLNLAVGVTDDLSYFHFLIVEFDIVIKDVCLSWFDLHGHTFSIMAFLREDLELDLHLVIDHFLSELDFFIMT